MEYMTLVVRWCCTPQPHINFITDHATNWHMSRWTDANPATQHLTVICVRIAPTNVIEYVSQMLSVMKNLWIEPTHNLMFLGALDTLLETKNAWPATINKYSVTHTDIGPGVSFYNHVINTMALVGGCNWTIRKDLITGDSPTTFQLYCKHEPHSVTVLVPGPANKTITVRCEEPQRIYDLLKRYGLPCSTVWDSTVALSARSPCTALCDHNMRIVNVNRIPQNDTFGEKPKISTFYHNMKHIQIQTKRKVLRHKPYTMPHRHPVDVPPLPSHTYDKNISTETEVECIPVALYYDNQMAKLSDVINADGRFVPWIECVDPHGVAGDKYMCEVEPDNNLTIIGTELANESDEGSDYAKPFACFCC